MPGQSGRTGAAPPWSPAIIAAIAAQAGFTGHGLELAVAVAMAESSGSPFATNVNSDSHHSVDRGLWQLNNYWHRDVSDACAYTPSCAARQAYRISNGGSSWSQWATFTGGQAQAQVGAAQDGIQTMRNAGGPSRYLAAQGVDAGHRWGANGSDASIGGVAGAVEDAAGAITAPLKWGAELASLLGKLNDSSTWLRGIEIVGGGVLMLGGLLVVARSVAGDVVPSPMAAASAPRSAARSAGKGAAAPRAAAASSGAAATAAEAAAV